MGSKWGFTYELELLFSVFISLLLLLPVKHQNLGPNRYSTIECFYLLNSLFIYINKETTHTLKTSKAIVFKVWTLDCSRNSWELVKKQDLKPYPSPSESEVLGQRGPAIQGITSPPGDAGIH